MLRLSGAEPNSGRMLGYSRAYNLPAIVGLNDHHVEQPKRDRRLDEHVYGRDSLGLISQEGPPVLRRCSPPSHDVLRDGRLADLDAELEKLAVDPRRTPEQVGAAHPPNQVTNVALHLRPARISNANAKTSGILDGAIGLPLLA